MLEAILSSSGKNAKQGGAGRAEKGQHRAPQRKDCAVQAQNTGEKGHAARGGHGRGSIVQQRHPTIAGALRRRPPGRRRRSWRKTGKLEERVLFLQFFLQNVHGGIPPKYAGGKNGGICWVMEESGQRLHNQKGDHLAETNPCCTSWRACLFNVIRHHGLSRFCPEYRLGQISCTRRVELPRI